MGIEMSAAMKEKLEQEKEREKREALESFVKQISEGPNLRVNNRIMKFTSLYSSDNLRKYYEKRKMEAGDCAADWIKSLAEKLGDLTKAPALAGLGALAIAVLIDIISFSPPEESTKDALRSVFAEEKASEVWDQIDECLKRYRMNIKNKRELVKDMKQIEFDLSRALTKLKNSMLRDGHMSSEALKVWVNGAAFHIQMLIHLVRLEGSQTCDPVKELLATYKNDLDPLFQKHEEMIKGKVNKYRDCNFNSVRTVRCNNQFYLCHIYRYCLVDEESKTHSWVSHTDNYDAHVEAYYDHRYSRQKRDIQQYFSDVGQNLPELIDQRGSFNID